MGTVTCKAFVVRYARFHSSDGSNNVDYFD